MTLQEAINHIDEVINHTECEACKNQHIQLKTWLIELKNRRENENEARNNNTCQEFNRVY